MIQQLKPQGGGSNKKEAQHMIIILLIISYSAVAGIISLTYSDYNRPQLSYTK